MKQHEDKENIDQRILALENIFIEFNRQFEEYYHEINIVKKAIFRKRIVQKFKKHNDFNIIMMKLGRRDFNYKKFIRKQ